MQVKVKVETRGALRYLARIQKKQIPFATAQALNSTIFDVRKQIVGPTWDAAFEVRNKRFASATFRVEKANKRRLRASIYDRLGRASLDLHVEGGTKRPQGRSLAVPTDKIRRTASGKISRAKQPRNLARSFVGNPFGKGRGIWQKKPNGKGLQLVYNLEPSARLKRRFRYDRDAERVTVKKYPRHWEREFIRAVRTAR